MAFIQIISLKSGPSSCHQYFFKDGIPGARCHIEIGEVAYVPDNTLDMHLATDLVSAIDGRGAKKDVVNPEDLPAKVSSNA